MQEYIKTDTEVTSDPIVGIMFECRRSLKDDFTASVIADGHETFSAGLRQVMYRYVRRIKARSRHGQMQRETVPGAGGNGVSEETTLPEALGGVLQGPGSSTDAPGCPRINKLPPTLPMVGVDRE